MRRKRLSAVTALLLAILMVPVVGWAQGEVVQQFDNGSVNWSTGQVTAIDGSSIEIEVESVCVHGDSPGAVQIATAVRDRLAAAGVAVTAFS